MGYKVVVVGATGNVGREVLSVLAERNFPIDEIRAVASSRSIGTQVSFGEDETLTVDDLATFDFSGYDIAFFAAGSKVAKEYAPKAAGQGCTVIDKSSAFRMAADVPLIVPEVNSDALSTYRDTNIISNANCVAIPLAMALAPLHREVGIKRVVVSTYQSVSGAGRSAMDELFQQTRCVYVNQAIERDIFTKQIAFNIIPHIDIFNETTGETGEESKVKDETRKILDLPDLPMAVTCVRVPVFVGHSMSINVELDSPLSAGEARALLRESPGISIIDHRMDEGYVTPLEVAGEDNVFISRIRSDDSVENGLQLWVVADNLRKGAALNAVQIAESLAKINE